MQNTPKIEKARPEDFEKVYPLLLDFNNPRVSKDQWKNLFIDHWALQKDFCGYKMVSGDEIVGFLSYIFSQKLINDRWEKFCNLSSWIVKPEFRDSSMDLLYPILDLKDYTITSYTPTQGSYQVETKLFKFKIFDRYEVIMPALPRLSAVMKKKFKILTHNKHSQQTLDQYLTDYEKKVFRDHVKFGCDHVVITSGQGNLYLIFKKTYRRHLPFVKLYYAGNLQLFLHFLEDIRFRLPLALKSVGIVMDSRFLGDKHIPFKKKKDFYAPMVYKSDTVQPHEIDYLYSEFFLLGF